MLLADAAMLTRSVQATPAAFRAAGRRYAVVPISLPGCFHPKIHLRLGSDKARLIVGSANATAAGWCRNLEVLADLDWSARDEAAARGPLIRKAYDYLMHWLRDAPGEVVQYKCRLIERYSPWLRDLEANEEEVSLADGSRIDLFCERGGDLPSILRQLAGRAAGEKICRLIVLSPYWDANLQGLRELRKALSKCPTVIVLNPEKSSFPIDVLRAKDDFEFVALKADVDRKRFPHAKVILIETTVADHVLFGSANCSDDALGSWTGAARNAEVSVYRRLKPGSARAALGLDLGTKIHRSAILVPATPVSSVEIVDVPFNAGYLELADRVLIWYPAQGIEAAGARVSIDSIEVPVTTTDGRWRAELRAAPVGPLIARVILKSGRVSTPLIVHDEIALRKAAPGQIDGRLREAFDRIRAGTEDLLDLAQYAHMIFAPDPARDAGRRGRRGGAVRKKADTERASYGTPEEFRRAVSLQPATGTTGRFSVDDPGLLQVLSIVMRGVAGIGAQAEEETREEEDDRALDAGDAEDGDAQPGEDENNDQADDQSPSSSSPHQYFTFEQIDRRRKGLAKAMDAFQELLTRLTAQPSLLSNRLAAQTTFMIQMMMLACTFNHKRKDGASVRLMVLYPMHDSERDFSFALRVARMLKAIWVGRHSLSSYIVVDERHQSLPDDMVAWIVLSRWAIARAFLAGRNTKGILVGQIGDVAREVYVSTAALGPIAPDAETDIMRELEARIGTTPSEAEELLRYSKGLRSAGVVK